MANKIFTVNTLLWLALVLALAGSLKHLAAIFASIDGSYAFGLLQAIAIDAGLFALAYSIRQRKAAKRSTKILWAGVAMFTTISVYGNLAYGLMATGNLPGWIETIKPYILAGSLPILVLFLSELLSDDRQHEAKEQAKEQRQLARQTARQTTATAAATPAKITTGNTANLPETAKIEPPLATLNEAKTAAKQQRLEQMASVLRQQPETTNTELADMLDVSRATIRNYRKELNGVTQ